jgi:RND family efflux transporter MFP subunit
MKSIQLTAYGKAADVVKLIEVPDVGTPGPDEIIKYHNYKNISVAPQTKWLPRQQPSARKSRYTWIGPGLALILLAIGVAELTGRFFTSHAVAPSVAAPPVVTVSAALMENLDIRQQFLGQFSSVESVELRAQVGGTLTQIAFKDGDIVHKGDILFQIDPTPYEIKLNQVTAQLESAKARLELATRELNRANELRLKNVIPPQDLDQRIAEQQGAQGAVDEAKAAIADARFDLDHTRITAPFTGQIGTHLVSVGNLIAGSRAASSPTTLLATIVSLDPIYLDFDMSEADYMAFIRSRAQHKGVFDDKVYISLSDERSFTRQGTLYFIDNRLDRSSGTIHARATVPNSDLLLTSGSFARIRLVLSNPSATLLVPDAAVLPDQSEHVVLTVGANDVVTPKIVQTGDLRGGLRVIRSGLDPADKVIIDGIPKAVVGSTITPHAGSIQFGSDQN